MKSNRPPMVRGEWNLEPSGMEMIQRCCLGFEYTGPADPSRMCTEEVPDEVALQRVQRVLLDVDAVPYVPTLFSARNPPKPPMAWTRRRKKESKEDLAHLLPLQPGRLALLRLKAAGSPPTAWARR
jgi:hypothetical protein